MKKKMSDRRGKEFDEPKNVRRKLREMSSVQRLYETCKEVFAHCGPGVVPSPSDVKQLKSVLDGMTEVDVGLEANLSFFMENESRLSKITYLHLYDCDKFSIGIFCLPPSGVIPLHNHPEMTVFSKLLFGTMHIKSYDWLTDETRDTTSDANSSNSDSIQTSSDEIVANAAHPVDIQSSSDEIVANAAHPVGMRLAKLKVNSKFTAPSTSILYPADGGNMHCFTASTPCAVLDVLGPPYSDSEGRHCTYFLEFPFTRFSVDGISVPDKEAKGYAWLQESEKPKDFVVVGAPYCGPKIMEN